MIQSSWAARAPATGGDGFHATHTSPTDVPVHHQEVNVSCHQTSDRRSLPLLLRNLGPPEGLPSCRKPEAALSAQTHLFPTLEIPPFQM